MQDAYVIKVGLFLSVLVIIYLAFLKLKKRGHFKFLDSYVTQNESKEIKIIEKKSIGLSQSLILIEVSGQKLLLSVAKDKVELLTDNLKESLKNSKAFSPKEISL